MKVADKNCLDMLRCLRQSLRLWAFEILA